MYLLNLSLLQFVAVFGSISALAVALYLLDRSRRKQVVSTLRFWVGRGTAGSGGAAQAYQSAVVPAAATAQHGASIARDCATAAGIAGTGGPQSRSDSGHFVVDGRPVRQPHFDGSGTRPGSTLCPGASRARSRHAGARGCFEHPGYRLRTGPPPGGDGRFRNRSPGPRRSISTRRSASRATYSRRAEVAPEKSHLWVQAGPPSAIPPASLRRATCGCC